jgi:hypothetical protein
MEKNLHSLQNYLIFSLAVADLMVACLVMPLGAVYEVSFSVYSISLFTVFTSKRYKAGKILLCCTWSSDAIEPIDLFSPSWNHVLNVFYKLSLTLLSNMYKRIIIILC